MSFQNNKGVVVAKRPASGAKKKQKVVWFFATECKYSVILKRVKEIQWKCVIAEKNESKCNLYWVDVATIQERFKTIQPWQCINHFPGKKSRTLYELWIMTYYDLTGLYRKL